MSRVTLALDIIPADLKELPQWVAFTPTKAPKNPATGKAAKTNDPATWGSFAQAVALWRTHQENGISGIGFVFSPDDPYCGVDLDNCRNPDTGEIEPWAREIINRLNSYTEVSPSGRGVHILVRGKLPGRGRRDGQVEIYDRGRYFTVTGQHLPGTPTTIENRQSELKELYEKLSRRGNGRASKATTPDSALSPPGQGSHEIFLIPEGQRNTNLVRIAGTMRRCELNQDGIERGLQALNQAICDPPLPEDEVSRIARSVSRYSPGLTRKGDPWAAVQALADLDGQRKWVRYKDLKERIMANQGCSERYAKEVIRKALKEYLIEQRKNGRGGYRIRKPICD